MAGLEWGNVVLWVVALAQAAAGVALVSWMFARGHGPAVLVVPVVSLALTLGIGEATQTVRVACGGRVLAAFEQVPPPAGVSVEPFVSPGLGCMAETPTGIDRAKVFDHYRHAFSKDGWRLVSDDEEGMRGEGNGVYVYLYKAEGRVYFILGRKWL